MLQSTKKGLLSNAYQSILTTPTLHHQPLSATIETMAPDKYSAVWVSHTSISDFLACPRAYYLKNIYRDPKTNHKIKVMSPPLALGQAVHEVIEALSLIPTEKRFADSLVERFDTVWKKLSGKKGGFTHQSSEDRYRKRGEDMLRRVMKNPGLLVNKAVKIKERLPHYWLDEEANIILCGKIDWLEYIPQTDSVHIVDFKTSKKNENDGSLQLPIYHLLVHNCQKRTVSKASYWYIERDDSPVEKQLPNLDEAHDKILNIAKQIKTARQLKIFKCPHETGCYACQPYEAVLQRDAEYIGTDEFNYDVYIIPQVSSSTSDDDSVIL